MMNVAFVGKMSQSTTLLFTAPLQNHSYKNSFGGLIQGTIHRSLKLWRNFYSELLQKSATNKFKFITPCVILSTVVHLMTSLSIFMILWMQCNKRPDWNLTLSMVALGKQYWVIHYRKWFGVSLVFSVTLPKIKKNVTVQ